MDSINLLNVTDFFNVLTNTQNDLKLPKTSQNESKPVKETKIYRKDPENCETIQNNTQFQICGNLEFSTSFCFSNFDPKCPNLGILGQEVSNF